MGRRIIKLKYEATCKDCGATLPAGAPARYYGTGKVYGTECHEDTRKKSPRRQDNSTYTRTEPEQAETRRAPVRSNFNPHAQAEG